MRLIISKTKTLLTAFAAKLTKDFLITSVS